MDDFQRLDKIIKIVQNPNEHKDTEALILLKYYLEKAAADPIIKNSESILNILKILICEVGELWVNQIKDRTAIEAAIGRSATKNNATAGANSRQSNNRIIKKEAIRLYKSGSWPSVRQASIKLKSEINSFCDAQDIPRLSAERCEKTIYDWLLASNK